MFRSNPCRSAIMIAFAVTVVLSAAPRALAQVFNQIGRWDPPPGGTALPDDPIIIVPMHAVHLHTGEILFWKWGSCAAKDDERLWNPENADPDWNASLTPVVSNLPIDCAGHAMLADGSILVVGGGCGGQTSIQHTAARFFPTTKSWLSLPDMLEARWYPTTTVLPDGKVLVSGGSHGPAPTTFVQQLEIFDPEVDPSHISPWQALASSADRHVGWYPWMFVIPDGRVFFAGAQGGSDDKAAILNLDSETWQPTPVQQGFSGGGQGSAVMYEPGKVLVTGGNAGNQSEHDCMRELTKLIDLSAPDPNDPPGWVSDEDWNLNHARRSLDLAGR